MTYYGGRELAASFRTVRHNTIKIAEDIPENKYDFKAAPDTRSVAQILTHVAVTPRYQQQLHGERVADLKNVDFPALIQPLAAEEARPRTRAEILALLTEEGDRFAAFLESLPESALAEPVAMPPGANPPTKSRLEMLLSAKEHEMHHRAQLMVIQRLLGIVPHLTRERQARVAEAPQARR
jgi:uncharacterized damage-inducible protein DinB